MTEYTEKIPQHRHCHICGKAFVGDGHFCTDECKNSAGKEVKKKLRKYMLVWIVIVAVTIAIIVAFGL